MVPQKYDILNYHWEPLTALSTLHQLDDSYSFNPFPPRDFGHKFHTNIIDKDLLEMCSNITSLYLRNTKHFIN